MKKVALLFTLILQIATPAFAGLTKIADNVYSYVVNTHTHLISKR